ncbi:MAG: thiol:disulfide interchange protein DsbG [Alphaproteobacteria bacterium]|nr:thiol:disulfide interchange protein DsbG [Alphaproteobacteria bacterium]
MNNTLFSPKSILMLGFAAFMFAAAPVAAQDTQEVIPELPEPIQNLVNEGAQIRYLGRDLGVDGWIAVKNGREQFFYVLPSGQAFLSGILFDGKGKAITHEQVRRLQAQGDETINALAADNAYEAEQAEERKQKYEFKTPSEQLYWDVENSNWIPVGLAGTPVLYAFVDPQCPHCHRMMSALREQIEAGKAQVRLIPVGLRPETKSQAAFLLASPDPAQTWWRHLDDIKKLPAKQEISTQGVERNLMVMTTWKLSATPLVVYRGKDQKVKIIQGNPKDIEALINDLGARS